MNTLVVYSSQTGNTRKLAQALCDGLAGPKQIHTIDEAPGPEGFDLVVMGFWLMGGQPDPKSRAYLPRIGTRNLFLLATHGAAADSAHARAALDQARALAAPARICGVFNCPGAVNPAVLEKAHAKNPPPVWLADAPAAVGRPNADDLQALRDAFARALDTLTH